MEKKRATTIGFATPFILWSTMVGLIRGVSEGLGAVGGAAMIYSLSGLLLIFTVGFSQPAPDPASLSAGRQRAVCQLWKSASRCRWAMPPAASRPLRWEWSITCGPA